MSVNWFEWIGLAYLCGGLIFIVIEIFVTLLDGGCDD